MRALCYTIQATNPILYRSYGGPHFFVFGRLTFQYKMNGLDGLFNGPTHWLETPNGVAFCERPDPVSFLIQLKPGLSLKWNVDNTPASVEGIGVGIGNVINSPLAGKIAGL